MRSLPPSKNHQQRIQQLLQLFNNQQWDAAIELAKEILLANPQSALVNSLLASSLSILNKPDEAIPFFKKATQLEPRVPEHHFNLALALTTLEKHLEAIPAYEKAVQLNPQFAVAHFNLGVAHLALADFSRAIHRFATATQLQPTYTEAWGNLGVAQQRAGLLPDAITSYQKALSIQPKVKLYISLGSALHNQGKLSAAIEQYRAAIQLDNQSAEAYDKLGSALWAQGHVDGALEAHERALSLNPNFADAHYHLAVILQEAKLYDRALNHFESSQLHDWQARCLYCLYKSKQYEGFKNRLIGSLHTPHVEPLIATLSTHFATNFNTADPYSFCPAPIDFVYHGHIPELDDSIQGLREALLKDILQTDIAERKQGRLVEGIQSAGNLFRRDEQSFQQLARCILEQVKKYQQHFAGADCALIQHFPEHPEFTSAWFIKMRQGGHLTSHIHEEGWISGSVYLSMPDTPPGRLDGSIEFSTDGDDYPKESGVFPVKVITPKVGDIVLFPSSLFHRTLPFESGQDRVCIAFDIRPPVTTSAL